MPDETKESTENVQETVEETSENTADAPTEEKLVVRNIVGEAHDGLSRVIVTYDIFAKINQSISALWNPGIKAPYSFEGGGDATGKGVRTFNIGGINLYAHYKRADDEAGRGRLFLFMKTDDANKCLMTLEQQRAGEEKLPFDLGKFDLDTVYTASDETVASDN